MGRREMASVRARELRARAVAGDCGQTWFRMATPGPPASHPLQAKRLRPKPGGPSIRRPARPMGSSRWPVPAKARNCR